MQVGAPLIIVDVLRDVVTATDTKLFPTLNRHILYTHGRSVQILKSLTLLNNGVTTKATRFPLFAVFQDFPQQMGNGPYVTVKFPKLSIACLTDSNDLPPARYPKTFLPILYPIYGEFMRQLAKHPNVVGGDPWAFPQILWERPGSQPEGGNQNEYVDALEINNLEVTFKIIKKCS